MDFRRFQRVNGRLVQAPNAAWFAVGDGTTRNPSIPNLPIGNLVPTALGTPLPEIAFASSSTQAYGSRTNSTVTAPSGIVDGDILLAFFNIGDAIASPAGIPVPTLPSGWAHYDPNTEGPLELTNGATYSVHLYICWKRASSESGNYTWTHATAFTETFIAVYRNCLGSGTPLGAITTDNNGTDTTGIGLSLNTTASRSRLIFAEMDLTGAGGLTPPDGMTERYDGSIYVADQRIATIQTAATRRHTVGAGNWVTRQVELLAGAGSSNTTAAGAASGVGTAAGIGRSTARDAASASGIGVATATGRSTARSSGTAGGVGAASATGRGVTKGSGTASATGIAAATGRSTARSPGSAIGIGAALGIGKSTARSTGAAAGTGTATGVGKSTARSAGAAAGVGSASAVGSTGGGSAGSASASGSATATGRSTARSSALGAGIGTALGVGQSRARSDAAASGLGAGLGIGRSTARGIGNATATGVPSGAGKVTSRASGSASGTGMAAAASTAGGGGVTDDWSARMGGSERLSSLAL